jgi:hypothetical protein
VPGVRALTDIGPAVPSAPGAVSIRRLSPAALVAFPEAGNIDALELGIDLDGLERMG